MKKIISIFVVFLIVFFSFGCTTSSKSSFKNIMAEYSTITAKYPEIYGKGKFENGQAQININFQGSTALANAINQSELYVYEGEQKNEYIKYSLLGNSYLTHDENGKGTYIFLFDSIWNNFYSKVSLMKLESNNLIASKKLKSALYSKLAELDTALENFQAKKDKLEEVAIPNFNPVATISINALNELFDSFEQLLSVSLNINFEFEKILSDFVEEAAVEELPVANLNIGATNRVVESASLKLAKYFIYKYVNTNTGLDNMSSEDKELLAKYKSLRQNIKAITPSQYMQYNNAGLTSMGNILYCDCRINESVYDIEVELFTINCNRLTANELFATNLTRERQAMVNNVKEFTSVYESYLEYVNSFINELNK